MVSHEETANTVLFYGKYTSNVDEDYEAEEDEWEGTVRRLTRSMERSAQTVKTIVAAKCDKIQVSMEESSKKEAKQGRFLKAHIDNSIKAQSEDVKLASDEMTQIASKLESKIEQKIGSLIKEIQERSPQLY